MVKEMKDYTKKINLETTNDVVSFAIENGYYFEQWFGTMNDCYIIETENDMTLKGVKPRAYMVLYFTYKNCYDNDLWVLMTDDESKVEKLRNEYNEYYELAL